MGRRGYMEWRREVQRHSQVVPHPRVVDKNWEGYSQ